jgi:hypothetical protein
MSRGLIIIDSDNPFGKQNQCFDPKYEYIGFGSSINVRLAREAKLRNLEILTADVYLESNVRYSTKKVLITEMVTKQTEQLLKSGLSPCICFCLESPLIARRFYHNLDRYAGRFHHNYLFRGTKERLAGTHSVFHPVIFPTESRIPNKLSEWESRNFLIMINSNKRAAFNKWDSFMNITHSTISQLYFLMLKSLDPWMRIREIYVDRIKAMYYFSAFGDFSLYGYGWQSPIQGFGKSYHLAAKKSYKGVISSDIRDKRKVMSDFKYALCFENCVFPGYITEKIFDSFLAGCIPVYYGAPDITDFVPAETFIDFRRFKNYSDLEKYLRGLSQSEAGSYINAAHEFITGPGFDKFTVDYLVNDFLNNIEQELNVTN